MSDQITEVKPLFLESLVNTECLDGAWLVILS